MNLLRTTNSGYTRQQIPCSMSLRLLGSLRVLWVHMAWHKNIVLKKHEQKIFNFTHRQEYTVGYHMTLDTAWLNHHWVIPQCNPKLRFMLLFAFSYFLNTICVSSHVYPENPEGTQVIVGLMNMGYIRSLPGIELTTCSVSKRDY